MSKQTKETERKLDIKDFYKVILERKHYLYFSDEELVNSLDDIEVSKEIYKLFELSGDSEYDLGIMAVAGAIAELSNLGYRMSNKLVYALLFNREKVPNEKILSLLNILLECVKEFVGADVRHKVLYKNFPEEVIQKSDIELYVNAVLHYYTVGKWEPCAEAELRESIKEKVDLKEICVGSINPTDLIEEITSSNTSITVRDYQHLDILFQLEKEVMLETLNIENKKMLSPSSGVGYFFKAVFDLDIPYAEIRAYVGGKAWETINSIQKHEWVRHDSPNYNTLNKLLKDKYIKTPTDLLRFATAVSKLPDEEKDLSLATDTKFVKFSRPLRRVILYHLDRLVKEKGVSVVLEEMKKYQQKWLRLGEAIHPSETKHVERYPNAGVVYLGLRNNVKTESFNSKVEELVGKLGYSGENIQVLSDLIALLSNRPTEFARRLDKILRSCNSLEEIELVKMSFVEIADKVSTPVLWELISFFKDRKRMSKDNRDRLFSPKGKTFKSYIIEDNRRTLSSHTVDIFKEICKEALDKKIREQVMTNESAEVWTCSYVSPKLKNYALPKSMRSQNSGLKTLTRNSKVDISDMGNTFRLFAHWKNMPSQRVDLDLSVGLYNEEWEKVDHVSYTNLRTHGVTHSGDIVDAPNGASEFIDIDINKLRQSCVRYIVPMVFVYTDHPLKDIPECFVGWMSREDANKGEIFEPKSVVNKFDLATDTNTSIPLLIDLQGNELKWLDVAITTQGYFPTNIEANGRNAVSVTKALHEKHMNSLYKLFFKQSRLRGEIVGSVEELNERLENELFKIEEEREAWRNHKLIDEKERQEKIDLCNIRIQQTKESYKVFVEDASEIETKAHVITPEDKNFIMGFCLR